jgi:RimJ/RimL family protein N-acetyltransferase
VRARSRVIVSQRLLLRPHRANDLDECVAMWADPVVTRYIGGIPFNREATWGRLLRYAGMWALLGYSYWVIEDKTTRAFIGEVGFGNFKRDISDLDAADRSAPEMGWALSAVMHGHGYATEAVGAALRWAAAHLAASRVTCLIDARHSASIRVAAKNGFTEQRSVTYRDVPLVVFARALRSEGD